MLKFELEVDSANAEFATVQEALFALSRITMSVADYAEQLVNHDGVVEGDTLACGDGVHDINGIRVGWFSLVWIKDDEEEEE